MLLFTKKRWQDKILSGEKKIEIRGARFAGLRAGDQVSINGRYRRRIMAVQRFDSGEELIDWLSMLGLQLAGFDTEDEARATILACKLEPPLVALFLDECAE